MTVKKHSTNAIDLKALVAEDCDGMKSLIKAALQEVLEAEKLCPQSSSVIALTLRVETPCTYISAKAATKAFSERW